MNNLKLLISSSYNIFKLEKFNGSGVYMIKGLVASESLKQTIYIGSSNNLKRRILSGHLSELKCNRHVNQVLQNYYNKYGIENIEIYLLESCNPCNNIFIEQKYLDLYRPFSDESNGFNIAHYAESSPLGRKASEDSKRKMSKAQKGKLKSEEHKQKLSESQKGENAKWWGKKGKDSHNFGKHHTAESREQMSKRKSKVFCLISPENEIITGINLKKFSRDNNLSSGSMNRVSLGKLKHYKGWRKG